MRCRPTGPASSECTGALGRAGTAPTPAFPICCPMLPPCESCDHPVRLCLQPQPHQMPTSGIRSNAKLSPDSVYLWDRKAWGVLFPALCGASCLPAGRAHSSSDATSEPFQQGLQARFPITVHQSRVHHPHKENPGSDLPQTLWTSQDSEFCSSGNQ